jgi:hypothetical protein
VDDLTGSILALELAVSQMRDLEEAAPQMRLTIDPAERALLKADLDALRLDLRRVEGLARNGEDFWRGWSRMLGVEPGYTASGVVAPSTDQPSTRIAVTG